jgi:hypothetical protein
MMILLACAGFLVARWKLKSVAGGKDVVAEPVADVRAPQVGKEKDL